MSPQRRNFVVIVLKRQTLMIARLIRVRKFEAPALTYPGNAEAFLSVPRPKHRYYPPLP